MRRIDRCIARSHRRRLLFRVAAVLIPCALIAGLWANLNSRMGGALFTPVRTETIATAAGERKEVIFQDGTRVFLNAGSTLTYPERFGLSERKVTLDGEAYFDVTHDAQHPFIVTTSAFRVRVLGTVFNVRSFSGESVAEATLAEGSVALQHPGGRNLICLHPGQQAVYDADAEQLEVNEVPVGDLLLIRYGVITLDNATLPEIIGRIEQAYGVELRPDGQQMPDDHYNFNFQKDASVEDVVDLLQFVSGCRFKIIQLNR